MTIEALPTTDKSFPVLDAFSSDLGKIIERIQPSVVQVRRGDRGAGTGVIWHENGSIITNHHVVASAGTQLQVELQDGRVLDAYVVDSDPAFDVAMLKVTENNLKAAPVGDSAKLRVGELVFAIGNPWGQRGVVTAGIVSALSEVKARNSNQTMEYIKSDVRLAPGNSGGPLLNAQGGVVGINAMIMGGDLSVAIPSNVVSAWAAQLTQTRISLGVQIQPAELPASIRQKLASGQSLGMLVVGEAARPAEFADELPDIDVIVLAEEGLLEELQRAVGGNRTPALVVLSSNNNRLMTMLNALAPHGWAVVPADASTAQLQAAVAAAAQGLIALPTLLAEQLLEQRGVVALSDIDTALPDEALTTREREVLELLSRGLPNKLIARRLQISEHTVKFHVSSIYAKLGATSRTDAVSRGVRRGLITL